MTASPAKPLPLRLHTNERRTLLFVVDFIVAVLALLVAVFVWAQSDWFNFSQAFLTQRLPFWFWFLPLVWMVLSVEMYDVNRASRWWDTVRSVILAGAIGFALYLVVFFLAAAESLPRVGVAVFIGAAMLLTLVWRYIYIRIFTTPAFLRRVLIVGAGKAGSTLARVISGLKPPPFMLMGYVDDDPEKISQEVEGYPVLSNCLDLERIITEMGITDLVFAITGDVRPETFRALLRAQERGVELTTVPVLYESLMGRVPIYLLQPDWILRSFVEQTRYNGFYEGVKRLMDIVGGLVLLVAFILLIPPVALAIVLDSGRPVFFRQQRLGKHGVPYSIIKYRTWGTQTRSVTRVGKFLRKAHIDELPQSINILRGEMSLVGPRAEQVELVDEYQDQIPFYRARLLVKPGLTGWAQVNQNYAANVEETAIKLELDLHYIKHRTLFLDLIILLRTFGAVFGLRGQ